MATDGRTYMPRIGQAILPIVHRPDCAEPDVHAHCACGQNRSCRTCGWGNGTHPCKCQRERMEARRA